MILGAEGIVVGSADDQFEIRNLENRPRIRPLGWAAEKRRQAQKNAAAHTVLNWTQKNTDSPSHPVGRWPLATPRPPNIFLPCHSE